MGASDMLFPSLVLVPDLLLRTQNAGKKKRGARCPPFPCFQSVGSFANLIVTKPGQTVIGSELEADRTAIGARQAGIARNALRLRDRVEHGRDKAVVEQVARTGGQFETVGQLERGRDVDQVGLATELAGNVQRRLEVALAVGVGDDEDRQTFG